MQLLRVVVVGVLLGLMSSAHGLAAEDPDSKAPGLAVGNTAPAFSLRDQSNQERSLSALLAKGPVALVFYRSAGW